MCLDTISGWPDQKVWTEWMSLGSPNEDTYYEVGQLLTVNINEN